MQSVISHHQTKLQCCHVACLWRHQFYGDMVGIYFCNAWRNYVILDIQCLFTSPSVISHIRGMFLSSDLLWECCIALDAKDFFCMKLAFVNIKICKCVSGFVTVKWETVWRVDISENIFLLCIFILIYLIGVVQGVSNHGCKIHLFPKYEGMDKNIYPKFHMLYSSFHNLVLWPLCFPFPMHISDYTLINLQPLSHLLISRRRYGNLFPKR